MLQQNVANLTYQSFHDVCLSQDSKVISNKFYESTSSTSTSVLQDNSSCFSYNTSKYALLSTSDSSQLPKTSGSSSSSSSSSSNDSSSISPLNINIQNVVDLNTSDENNIHKNEESIDNTINQILAVEKKSIHQ